MKNKHNIQLASLSKRRWSSGGEKDDERSVEE